MRSKQEKHTLSSLLLSKKKKKSVLLCVLMGALLMLAASVFSSFKKSVITSSSSTQDGRLLMMDKENMGGLFPKYYPSNEKPDDNDEIGTCNIGKCCHPDTALCPLQKILYFMGVTIFGTAPIKSERSICENQLDYYFGGPNSTSPGCQLVFTGVGRTKTILCTNATVTNNVLPQQGDNGNSTDEPDYHYCDVGIPPANVLPDFVLLYQHFFFPASGITRTLFGQNGEVYRYTALSGLMKIAFGNDKDNKDKEGVVDYVFKALKEETDCLTRPNAAVHLLGFSFGGILCQMLAVEIQAEFPNVFVRVSTAGEPASVIEPLSGDIAKLPAWNNSARYIYGEVKDKLLAKRQRIQAYDPSPQILPGAYYFEDPDNRAPDIIICNAVEEGNGDEVKRFLAGLEGCAVNRTDVKNEMVRFPYEGQLNQDTKAAERLQRWLDFFGAKQSLEASLNVVLSVLNTDLLVAVLRTADIHNPGTYMTAINKFYRSTNNCSATSE